jgi:hypothetical protein
MNIFLKDGFNYIPEFNGNNEAPKEEQFSIDFEFLSGADLNGLYYDNGKGGLAIDKEKQWDLICKKVNNFSIAGEAVEPKAIRETKGLGGLYSECMIAFRAESEISEDIKKK